MIFNSYIFIGAFLPTVLTIYVILGRLRHDRAAQVWLALASLFFYSWWNPTHLPVLLASIACNYALGRAIFEHHGQGRFGERRFLLALGVGLNLALLFYFKYTAFVINNVGALAGIDFAIRAVVLPLGISFFTFQQIAYLADAARGDAGEYDLVDYCLFVAFFPQLIAGPIVHHREMMSQFERPARTRLSADAFAMGVTFFTIGLFKKVVFADNLAVFANDAFDAVGQGRGLSAAAAWHGVIAYTLQLYFDFSGYSDMAIGLALMFGIRLPYNFNSPYKAVNIIDFWRRWHITLSRFLRDYLYIALGGNRRGRARRFVNLMLTMVLGGIWHGAGWTFLVWGTLHGVFLVLNHGWLWLRHRFGVTRRFGTVGVWTARLVTFLGVIVGWVYFRAPDMGAAYDMLRAMVGAHGWVTEGDVIAQVFSPAPDAGAVRVIARSIKALTAELSIVPLLLAVWLLPNSQEIVDGVGAMRGRMAIAWRPNIAYAACVSGCLLFALSQMSKVSAFLYFQF